ncbi:hypothetical protein FOL47_008371, partial [Perkinsus chesapeaki]
AKPWPEANGLVLDESRTQSYVLRCIKTPLFWIQTVVKISLLVLNRWSGRPEDPTFSTPLPPCELSRQANPRLSEPEQKASDKRWAVGQMKRRPSTLRGITDDFLRSGGDMGIACLHMPPGEALSYECIIYVEANSAEGGAANGKRQRSSKGSSSVQYILFYPESQERSDASYDLDAIRGKFCTGELDFPDEE